MLTDSLFFDFYNSDIFTQDQFARYIARYINYSRSI